MFSIHTDVCTVLLRILNEELESNVEKIKEFLKRHPVVGYLLVVPADILELSICIRNM